MQPTLIRDRVTGALVPERVFGEAGLRAIYGQGLRARVLRRVATSDAFNLAYGLVQRLPGRRAKVAEFVERLGIDASEAERPLADYPTLDAFFTRRLRPGARPIDPAPAHLVSPADGRALAWAEVGDLPVKGARVSVAALLGDPALAARYRGGGALVVRLAPADYHRTHWPADGVAGPPTRLGGPLHSVHPIALGAGAPSFLNRRAVTALDAPGFGRLAIVDVGALLVGRLVESYAPGPVRRGEEKGHFRMGGSTTVVLSEPGAVAWDDDLLAATRDGVESRVVLGTRVGRGGREPTGRRSS